MRDEQLLSASQRSHRGTAHVTGNENFRALCATISACAIGLAIHHHDGEYSPLAIVLVTIALLAAVVAIRPPKQFSGSISPRAVTTALLLAIATQFVLLFFTWPAGVDQQMVSSANRAIFLVRLTVAGMLILLGVAHIRFIKGWWFPALLIAQLWLGAWMIRSSPNPHIDVWVFQQQGARVLLHGQNPYVADEAKFPDIYHSTRPGAQDVYGPGMSKNDVLQFGFPYPPLSLELATIGYKLTGDCRYAQAVAIALAGLFIGYSRGGLAPKLAAALLIFTPRVFFILGRAWTEPFVVMLLAATIFCAWRRPRWLPIALGLFLVSKQYLIFALPLTVLLADDPFDPRSRAFWKKWIRLMVVAAIAGAVVSLPLALWNWRQFWFSAFTVQKTAPFRWDALSYLVFIGFRNSAWIPGVWLAFTTMLLALAWSFWKAPRNAAGFALSLGLIFLVFFAFNKQAFCNYYFFTIAAFCCAIGNGDSPRRHGDTEARSTVGAAC